MFGAPYLTIHRADLHAMLAEIATKQEGVAVRLDSTVVGVDPELPSVTLASGEMVKGDLVIGANGLKSIVRNVVVSHPERPIATGDSAYRAVISTDFIAKDPELRAFFDASDTNGWLSGTQHVVAYEVVSDFQSFPFPHKILRSNELDSAQRRS